MDAKEILSKHTGETGIYLTKGQIRGSDAIEAMEEYATLRTQSIQDKVKELESALTESKLREERLREHWIKTMLGGVYVSSREYALKYISNLLSSNQADPSSTATD